MGEQFVAGSGKKGSGSRKQYALRAITAAIEYIESHAQSQLSRIVIEQLVRSRSYIGMEYPTDLSPIAPQTERVAAAALASPDALNAPFVIGDAAGGETED